MLFAWNRSPMIGRNASRTTAPCAHQGNFTPSGIAILMHASRQAAARTAFSANQTIAASTAGSVVSG